MSDLTFTIARFGFLALLWFFIFLIVRALRRDTVEASASAPQRRRDREPSPAAPQGRRRGATPPHHHRGPARRLHGPVDADVDHDRPRPDCTLVLNDSYASSHHARVFPKDGAWWLEDLNSTNGTTLAGRAVHGAVELPVGVPVRIGQTTLELRP